MRYYDAGTRKIKVSRNYIFAEAEPTDKEFTLRRLELEGESEGGNTPQSPEKNSSAQESTQLQAPTNKNTQMSTDEQPATPKPTTEKSVPSTSRKVPSLNISYQPKGLNPIPLRRSTREHEDHDYRKINNPDARIPAFRPISEANPQDNNEEASSNQAVDEICFMGSASTADERLPQTINEAKASPEWPEWEKAINEEYSLLECMGTWELDDLPPE